MTVDPAERSAHDDLTTYRHRQVIGWLGASLPFAVLGIVWLRHANDARPTWQPLSSISAYYHTTGVVAFVGVLAALSVYLLTYKGFGNDEGWVDRLVGRIAGVAAALVASFPTRALTQPEPKWLTKWVWGTHLASATVLFTCFMIFSLFLFTKSGPGGPDLGKRVRNGIYVVCGVAIFICLVTIIVVKVRHPSATTEPSIFWPEAIALEFFALSWLTKGRADQPVVNAATRTVHAVRSRLRAAPEPKRTEKTSR